MGFSYFILPSNNQKEDIDDNNVSNEQEETKSLIKNEPIFINGILNRTILDISHDIKNILK
jgi:hypothetical protein